jgi:hypothetical protein
LQVRVLPGPPAFAREASEGCRRAEARRAKAGRSRELRLGKPVKSDAAYQIKFRITAPETPPFLAKRPVGITLRPANGADDFSRRDPDSIVKQPRKKSRKAANARQDFDRQDFDRHGTAVSRRMASELVP